MHKDGEARKARGPKLPALLPALPEEQKVLGALCSTLATTSRNQNGLGAQGRRGREADPDSRSASEGRESAKRERAA